MLLQYHAGTLNYDIRRILVDFLLKENTSFVQDIDWKKMLSLPQFSGQTRSSINQLFNSMVKNTARYLGCERDAVNITDIAKHTNAKANPANINNSLTLSGKDAERREQIIKFYRSLEK